MLVYSQIDPVIVSIGPYFGVGPLAVHWYGVMYLLGLAAAWWISWRRMLAGGAPVKTREEVDDLIFYGALGVILGGRIGYILFYQLDVFLENPLWLLRINQGGMSFHGGLLGVIIALGLYARRLGVTFFTLLDFVAPLVPIGLGLGRLGNFINQELWGRATDVAWAMIFPADPLRLPRHPSQLYQFALEGVVLFIVLQIFSRMKMPTGVVSGLFLVFYALFRFGVEFFREPDVQIGYELLGWMTRGQELCVPMLVAGVVICIWAVINKKPTGV